MSYPPPRNLRVVVEVRIDANNSSVGYGSLQVREELELPVCSFMELAGVLGRFHELAEKIKSEQQPPPGTISCLP